MNSNYDKLLILLTDPDVIYELEERVGIRIESGISEDRAKELTYQEYVERSK